MIIESGVIYTSVNLYTIIIYTDGIAVYMCPCMLFVSTCVICCWLHMWQLWYAYVCGYFKVTDLYYIGVPVFHNITTVTMQSLPSKGHH